QAVLTREKYRLRIEITLHARGEKFLHGMGDSNSWEVSMAQAIEKITQQAQKVKGKWQERKRRGTRRVPPAAEGAEPVAVAVTAARERPRMPRVFRASKQAIKSMSVAEAAREIDVRSDGLVVFRDPERAAISILYRRQDGQLTLVETET